MPFDKAGRGKGLGGVGIISMKGRSNPNVGGGVDIMRENIAPVTRLDKTPTMKQMPMPSEVPQNLPPAPIDHRARLSALKAMSAHAYSKALSGLHKLK